MGIDQLIGRLEERAKSEAETLLEEARREAEEIRRQADRRIQERREERLSRRERELRDAAEARIAEVRREGDRQVMEVRKELLDGVYQEAADRLDGDQGLAAFAEELEAALVRALEYLEEGALTVACRPELAGPAREALAGAGREGEVREADDAEVGLVVRASGGHPLVRDTYPERLRRQWPELAIQIVDLVEERG